MTCPQASLNGLKIMPSDRPTLLKRYGWFPGPPLFHSYTEAKPPRLVCSACSKAGHVILMPPHDNPYSSGICPHCQHDNNVEYVYLMQSGNSTRYKIGYTGRDPRKRSPELQTGNPDAVTLIDVIECADGRTVEKSLHRAYRHYQMPNSKEWFDFSCQQVVSHFKECWQRLKTESLTHATNNSN